jgi:hypothetical protein
MCPTWHPIENLYIADSAHTFASREWEVRGPDCSEIALDHTDVHAMLQKLAPSQRACSGLQASTSSKDSRLTVKGATVPRARAVASTPGQEAQSRRRISQHALAIDCEVLSCPWPRTLEASRVAPERRGLLSGVIYAVQQVIARRLLT